MFRGGRLFINDNVYSGNHIRMTTKTEIGHCRDCKWWGEVESEGLYKECSVITNDLIIWMDRSAGVDSIETDPNFGCIHWKEKEDEGS